MVSAYIKYIVETVSPLVLHLKPCLHVASKCRSEFGFYANKWKKCVPVGCVPPAWWVYPVLSMYLVGRGGGGLSSPLDANPTLDADYPLGCRPSLDADPPGHVTCDACCEANPTVNRMMHMCKNITLPLTSFAGGKNVYTVIWHGDEWDLVAQTRWRYV